MRNLAKNFIFVLLIFLVISAVFSLFSKPFEEVKELSITQLVQDIEQEKIKKIVVSGNELQIIYQDGSKARSRKESEVALSESLSNYGVEKDKLAKTEIEAKETEDTWAWLGSVLFVILPLIFFGFFFWMIFRQAKTGAMQAFDFTKARARIFGPGGRLREKVTFDDVGGLKEAKEELKEVVDFLKNPKKYLGLGARIPRGALLIGAPGTGKCVVGDTFVFTSKGLIKIKDIPKYFRIDKKGKVYGAEVFTINFKNLEVKKESPSHWFNLGIQKTIKIVSRIGIELEGTPEHPIVILDKKNGNFEFKRLDQIKKGDLLVVNYGHQAFGNYKILSDKETAYLLGFLTGDGGLSIKDRIYISNRDRKAIKFIKDYFKTRFGINLKKSPDRKYDWYIANWQIKEKFREYGLTDSYARGKRIPESILFGPKEFQVVFLQGIFDTDSYVDVKNSAIQLSSASKNLIREVSILLLNLGIISRFHQKRKIYNKQLQYYLEISGDFVKNFAKEIGFFNVSRKQKDLEKILEKSRNTNINLIPYQQKRLLRLWKYFLSKSGRLNRDFHNLPLIKNLRKYRRIARSPSKYAVDQLLEFLTKRVPTIKNLLEYKYLQKLADNRFFFTPVVEIIKNGKGEVYDFTVPHSHTFVANGLINHNTLLAKAIASQANVPFFSISASEVIELFVGVGSARIRSLFEQARKAEKAIIFIDEIDSIGKIRGMGVTGGHEEREQTLNQLLAEMDGIGREENLIIMGATNRPEYLDPALLRPGRFDRRIVLDLPDINEREEILKIHCRGKPLALDVNSREIAERTPGFSGADLANVVNEGAILAARRNKHQVFQEELLESIEKVLLGPARKSHILSKKEKEIAAYHESGHAIAATFSPGAEPVRKISIVARGLAAGYTLKMPTEEKKIKTKSEFLAEMTTLLGGYCAEKLKYGEMTTGAANDLERATQLARKLVTEFGMSSLGPITFGKKEELMFLGREEVYRDYSEKVATKIDEEVEKFVKNAEETARKILSKKKNLLEKIAQRLIKKETIEKEEFEELVGRHSAVVQEKFEPAAPSPERTKSVRVKIRHI